MIRAAGRAGRCPISAAAFIARGDTTRRRRWEWCLFDILSPSEETPVPDRARLLAIGDYRRAIAELRRARYFASPSRSRDTIPGDSLRGEAAAAEGVKRLLSHSSEFNREYITVRRRGRSGTTLRSLFLPRGKWHVLLATSS